MPAPAAGAALAPPEAAPAAPPASAPDDRGAAHGLDRLDSVERLEPLFSIVEIEPRLRSLPERLHALVAAVEPHLPGAQLRIHCLEGSATNNLGDGRIHVLPAEELESTPHFRTALQLDAPRVATTAPPGSTPLAGTVSVAVPLHHGDEPWGLLEVVWPDAAEVDLAPSMSLLRPLARLLEIAIANQQTLEDLVFVDPLTGVYNRAFYERQVALEIERAHRTNRKFALLVMDVDDFKSINDQYGHRAGDQVLAELAQTVRSRMRKIDLMFRYGGEEFVFLLPGAEATEARHTAERIRMVVNEHRFGVEGGPEDLQVTVSVGYAIYPDQSRTQSGLFKAADAALLHAKKQGKNRVATA